MNLSAKLKAREVDIVLLAVAMVWGASYLAAKVLTTHASVVVVLSFRFILTALGMFAIWIIKRDSFSRGEILSIIGGVGAVLIVGATFFGQRIETAHRKSKSTNR